MSDLTSEQLDNLKKSAQVADKSKDFPVWWRVVGALNSDFGEDVVRYISESDPETILDLISEVERRRDMEHRVRETHYRNEHPNGHDATCYECGTAWPCLIIRTFDGGAE